MKLTGKCKEDFEKWIKTELYYLGNEPLSDLFINALEIEFFDSVGIYIGFNPFMWSDGSIKIGWVILLSIHSGICENRQEATNKAIEKANLLYNEKHL